MRATTWLMLATLLVFGRPVAAAEADAGAAAVSLDPAVVQPAAAMTASNARVRRPAIMPVLYASYGAAQAWDLCSTSAALRNGAREVNPVMAPLAGSPVRMAVVKAAATAGTIFFVERLWRQNRVAAVVLMTVINGATTAIAANNVRNARRAR